MSSTKPDKKPTSIKDQNSLSNSKYGVASKPAKQIKASESTSVLCCCIKFSNQCSCSSGSGGTADMTKEEIEL